MSFYEQGRAAYRARVSLEHARHWPTARRENWQRGWLDAKGAMDRAS
ncbi:MAG: hypothetical protein Q7J32_10785 [Sphingomonadaceae bacterium]|nr:hypothetical protein [Sphingomonadaceae bacterium]